MSSVEVAITIAPDFGAKGADPARSRKSVVIVVAAAEDIAQEAFVRLASRAVSRRHGLDRV